MTVSLLTSNYSRVSGHLVPLPQQDQVSRHNLRRIYFQLGPVPDHRNPEGEHLAKFLNRLFGTVLLDEGEDGIDTDDRQDGDAETKKSFAWMEIFGQEAEGGGKPEQQGQKMGKLGNKAQNHGAGMHLVDLVGAILAASAPCLFSRDPLGRAQQGGEYLIVGKGLDLHGDSVPSPEQDGVTGGLMHDITGRVAEQHSPQGPALTHAQHDQIIVAGDRFHGDGPAAISPAASLQNRNVLLLQLLPEPGNVVGHPLPVTIRKQMKQRDP